MHSFQPSRGRILFEFVCALGIVASCVGAWKQTGASALLVAAAVAGLYGFVRLFDMPGRRHKAATEPQRIEFAPGEEVDLAADEPAAEPPAVEPHPVVSAAEMAVAEPEAAPVSKPRRAKASRKASSRRDRAAEEALAADSVLAEVAEQREDSPLEQEISGDFADRPEVVEPEFDHEPAHVPHAPLFEPEPFVRMQRQAFGRRGRI